MSYICTCANGKTWGGNNDACNDNASKCAQCCSGGYGGVAGGMLVAGGIGCGSCSQNDETDGDCTCVDCLNGGQQCMPNRFADIYRGTQKNMIAGGVGCGSCGPNDETDGNCTCVDCLNGGQQCMPNRFADIYNGIRSAGKSLASCGSCSPNDETDGNCTCVDCANGGQLCMPNSPRFTDMYYGRDITGKALAACGSCSPNDEIDGDCSCVNCTNGGQMCIPNNPGLRSKKIIGYGEDGKPHCKCGDGNIYINCGDNCECCDHVDNNRIYLPKSYTKFETLSCPCSFYPVKNQLGDLECEIENFGVKSRVIPIKLTNHTVNGKMPITGDKWDCTNSKTCGKGTIKWNALYVISVKESTDNKFVNVVDSARSTSNCDIPKLLLNDYSEPNYNLEDSLTEETSINLSSAKQITSCHVNDRDIVYDNVTHNWNYKTYSSVAGKLEIKAIGELLKIKIRGNNKPTVDISIKDSSNRSLLKRKLKNIVIDGEYVLKQKIPALALGKTQETYNITITPSADTEYYYENTTIPYGILKYTVWQFKNPTITLSNSGAGDMASTQVLQGGTTTVSGAANSFSSKTITATTTVNRLGGTQNYYLTKKALIFDDLVKVSDSNKIKKFITNQEDAKELECRDTITIAENAREDLTSQPDLEIGMNFTGKIEKTKTVYKSINLDEHLQEPCDDDEIFDILTNKFELENTTDLFSGMEVRGIDNENSEFITIIESVDCEKGITLESHYIIKKETILTFTHTVIAVVSEINKNNIKVTPCVKLPNNTEITFNKSNKTDIYGRILVDQSGGEEMIIKTIIDSFYAGQEDITFNLDLSEFVSVKPPNTDQRLVCGKDDNVIINWGITGGIRGATTATLTSTPSNGTTSAVSPPKYGTLAGYLKYTPNTGFVGDDKFNFTLSDGVNTSDEKTIFIKVR